MSELEEKKQKTLTKKSPDSKDPDITPPKPIIIILIALAALVVMSAVGFGAFKAGQSQETTTPTPTPTPTGPTTTPSPRPTKKPISTSTPKPSVTPQNTPTDTPAPTTEPTDTPTNTPSLTPTNTPIPMADLYISEYSFDHDPVQDEPFTVRIGIYNQGNAPATSFWWEWWATTTAPAPGCREQIPSLVAGGGRIVTCTYTYDGWSTYTTQAIADANHQVEESDETNNTHEQVVVPDH